MSVKRKSHLSPETTDYSQENSTFLFFEAESA